MKDQAFGCALLVHVNKNPDLFSTTTSTKSSNNHENVKCPECNEVFSAKRNMKRHLKREHKAVESNTTENSNESNNEENLNPDDVDIDNVPFEIC